MAKYVLVNKLSGVQVCEGDDLYTIANMVLDLIYDDGGMVSDRRFFAIQDLESKQILYWHSTGVNEFGLPTDEWSMTKDVAEVLEWADVLDTSTLPLEWVS